MLAKPSVGGRLPFVISDPTAAPSPKADMPHQQHGGGEAVVRCGSEGDLYFFPEADPRLLLDGYFNEMLYNLSELNIKTLL